MNYKLSYDFDKTVNCGIIRFDDKYVLIDFSDLFSIRSCEIIGDFKTNEKVMHADTGNVLANGKTGSIIASWNAMTCCK